MAVYTFSSNPSTSASAAAVRVVSAHGGSLVVRASTDYNASVTSTQTADQTAYGGVYGMFLSVDQTAVAASSVGGGTGVLTHTIQFKDPIGATYVNTTGAIVCTTGVATWVLQCCPGSSSVAPTTVAVGKADLAVPTVWRINTTCSSSATNFTYSIAAVYLPTAASSS